MALITRIAFYLTLFAFFIGQLLRLNFLNFSFPLFDLTIVILAFFNLLDHQFKFKKSSRHFLNFIIFSFFTLVINLLFFKFSAVSFFYWLRLSSLLSFFIFPLKLNSLDLKIFRSTLAAFIIFAFLQYFIWPDLTAFSSLNWDPHLYRLVGTLLDPTFTALLFLFIILKLYFYFPNFLLISLTYLALALTYSRSTLLSLLVVFTYISIKSKKILIFVSTSLIICLTILLLPRMPGEGTKLERTSSIKAKIVNYQAAFKSLSISPLFGIGYNNIPQLTNNPTSHSHSGFDSSLLTIAVTTGIIGLYLFVKPLSFKLQKTSLYWQSLLLATFVHSLFANSLLYPWILFYLSLEFRSRNLSR